jgi:histidinol-phosphate phosphatase family protein
MFKLKKNHPVVAVFLDRDGTLIEDRGYLRSPDEVVFFDYTVETLRRLQPHFSLFIVTSQSGIAKGLQTPEEVNTVNAFVTDFLRGHGVNILKTYTCPHVREDDCRCIKPKPYLAQLAAEEFGIDLQRSYMIGDHPHDAEFGVRFGGTGLFVLTGHGMRHRDELDEHIPEFADLKQAADWILENCKEKKNI